MHGLLHELPNNLGFVILENEELVWLFAWIFIDVIICEFELVTCRFEIALLNWISTRAFKLSTCNS